MKKSDSGIATKQPSRLRELSDQLLQLETQLRRGGGPDKIDRQHQQGKLTARERIELLLDKDSYAQEIVVARDDQEDSARAGDRDAIACADYLSRRFRGRESSVPGRCVSGPVRRFEDLLLQLDHAPLFKSAADLGGDGTMHSRRRLFAGIV